jgi:hypothetical protein
MVAKNVDAVGAKIFSVKASPKLSHKIPATIISLLPKS